MKLVVLPQAQLEAAEAAVHYHGQRPGLGNVFLTELEVAYQGIREQPLSFAQLETYTGQHEIRRCLLHRFPYLVIYLRRPDQLLVVAISHVRRKPHYWLSRIAPNQETPPW